MGAELETTTELSENFLSLDLEVGVKDRRIHAFAAIRSNTEQPLTRRPSSGGLDAALAELDNFADGVDFVLGHNLIHFDLPHLRAANPNLRLLRLPAVDTLRLNPLAFPRNPYHHLVKHYQDGQLVRGRINNPELDARLAIGVFSDQQIALSNTSSDLLTAWHGLTTAVGGEGFDRFFATLRHSPRPTAAKTSNAIYTLLNSKACQTHTSEAIANADNHPWELAYALAWISVCGGNSVMPPWVRHQFPGAGRLVHQLRDTPCADINCNWCRERHNARNELNRWFRFADFREKPVDHDGNSIQQPIVEAAMAHKHVLGILPTGSGKSLCYQLPAISRYDKTGALTVVISPLVALMADQVASLERKGIGCCLTINGLLSMPERADALDRVRLGDAGIVLVAPEQLRSIPFRRALKQREIGAWVLDEAHCLSKWGHDFRPDYRYVGRFIRETAGEQPVPPVLCLTATAKPDVKADIIEYFLDRLDIELNVFDGGAQRDNLEFLVVRTSGGEKFDHVHQIIAEYLPAHVPGGAIVYCATRRQTEEIAQFLQANETAAEYFHAGLPPETKKDVQQNFISGELRVIAATNAFGMGIDKPDVRLVIHADIPGSLENFLQEAGRAGRDQQTAHCVLLYTPEDVERQFGMSAYSRLTRREIHGVLRALRNLDRRNRLNGEVVATAGEILLEDEDKVFQRDSATDDTRVRTAVAWLEEADLLQRDANYVRVFPSSLRVNSTKDARNKLETARIRDDYRRQLLIIVDRLIDAGRDQGISTDELMAASGLTPEGVRAALYDLEQLGIANNDTVLTAFVHAGVEHSSQNRYDKAAALECALIDFLREDAPDMDKGESAMLHLRVAAQRLKDAGHTYALPERLWRNLRSIAADGRGEGSGGGSLAVRKLNPEIVRVTMLRGWKALTETARLRRQAAVRLLEHLLSSLPSGSRGTDLLAETTLGQLLGAIKSDLILANRVKHHGKLMDRALLWLHEQEVIQLNKGLAVLRPAMTIRLQPERRGFARSDFQPLNLHYLEKTLQIHVIAEFAERGLEAIVDSLRMAMDYFVLTRNDFLRRWLPDRDISRQTTPESWRTIVESLRNPIQRRIVADDREQTNVLVLAGPGSGKTRVLVHRIAYLIRVRRENPRGILALAYNRHAAVEIRRRLAELIGVDARGVLVFTCHALAMRLVGASFEGRANRMDDEEFREILRGAAALLHGEGLPPDEADEYRARLLAGFRWILVDEYQDIGEDQYELISALAGRTLSDEDDKLSLFAVGDDDQNIYAFNGSSVEFIRRFEEDYRAQPTFLTGNYRSTARIIAASNALIEPAQQRMKTEHPIKVNRARRDEPHGGAWSTLDSVAGGKVQILLVGDNPITQAQAVVVELKRLSDLDPDWDWSKCAVIARKWRYLDPVRSLCELEKIPVQMANEDNLKVWHLRETRRLVDWLRSRKFRSVSGEDLNNWMDNQPANPWSELLRDGITEYTLETSGAETPANHFVEWLAEWAREVRRRQRGLLLLTAHRAKGLEFDHVVVLDGGWDRVDSSEDVDAPRRLYYVAMTRARHTLALARFPGEHRLQDALRGNPSVLRRRGDGNLPPPPPELERRYSRLSLSDIFLSFAGYKRPDDPVYRNIASLSPGDPLHVRVGSKRWELLDRNGNVVGQLASGFNGSGNVRCTRAKVWAIVAWNREYSEPQYQRGIQRDSWEVVVPELIFEPDS